MIFSVSAEHRFRMIAAAILAAVVCVFAVGCSITANLPEDGSEPAVSEDMTSIPELDYNQGTEEPDDEEEQGDGYAVYLASGIMSADGEADVYSVPDPTGEVIGSLSDGEVVNITGATADGWYRINFDGTDGFVANCCLSAINSSDSSNYVTVDTEAVMYATDPLNVRELPDAESEKLGLLMVGDMVNVTGEVSNGWYRIDYDGTVGYVYGEYLTETEITVTEDPYMSESEESYFSSEEDYLIVVNKETLLPDDYKIVTDYVQGSYELEQTAAYYCKLMIAAAAEDGINLKVLSAYRTVAYQQKLFDRNVDSRMESGMSYEEAYADTAINIAPAGGSEHNAGLAVDLVTENDWDTYTEFEDTEEFAWLREHAAEYGFILRYPKGKEDITGYVYEPWHYRYVGVKYAAAIEASGLCLEEYMEAYG